MKYPTLFSALTVATLLLTVGCGGTSPQTAAPSSSAPAASSSAAAKSSGAASAQASGGATSQWSPELTQIIEGAKKEGALNLSWGESVLGGHVGAPLFQDAMNKMFGTNIHISFTPGPAQPQEAAQLLAEYKAGQKAVTDVFITTAGTLTPLIQGKALDQIEWPKLLPGRITPDIVELGVAMRLITGIPGIEYNTKLVPQNEIPKTMEDVLKPYWKGKFATTPYAAGFDFLAAPDAWGREKTFAYVAKLAKQVSTLMRCGETERVASGAVLAFGLDCDGTSARIWQAKGAPVGFVVPLDAAQKRYFYIAVPKNSQHPNAAKLLTVFAMTPEGQQLTLKTWGADLDSFAGAQTKTTVQELEKQGAKFFAPTIQYIIDHPELNTQTAEMVKMLEQK